MKGRILRRADLDRPVAVIRGGRRGLAAEAAQDHVEDRAVHPLAHDVAEDRARGADQGAGDDQQVVLQREADARRGPAGIAVSAWTPRPACRRRRSAGSAGSRAPAATSTISQKVVPDWVVHSRITSRTVSAPRKAFRICWPVNTSGLPVTRPCSLAKATTEPEKVIAPDRGADRHFDQAGDGDVARHADAVGHRVEERRRGDEGPPPGRPGCGTPPPAAAAPSSGS